MDTTEEITPERVFLNSNQPKPHQESIIAFCFSYELDYINVFKMLEMFQIPILKADRGEEFPLIFAGGPVPTANPEPFSDFFDFFLIGDSETLIIEVLTLLQKNKPSSRKERLSLIAKLDGVYVPEFFDVSYNKDYTINSIIPLQKDFPHNFVQKSYLENIETCLYSSILTDNTVFSNTLLIETSRGCSQNCFFCLTTTLNRPCRFPPVENIINTIQTGLFYTRKVGLLSALVTDHPQFADILQFIYNEHLKEPVKLTTSSLRADKITAPIAHILTACNQKQITIAMEAGSERLRNSINKNLTNNDILHCISTCREQGIESIKIYAMVGLPDEEMNDIDDMIRFLEEIKVQNKSLEISLSLNTFIPKAHTYFEREATLDPKESKFRMDYIRKKLLKKVKVSVSSSKWDNVQALIAQGDRRLSGILLQSYNFGGTIGSFNRAFKQNNADYMPDFKWYTQRKKPKNDVLPWSHIKF